MEPSNPSEFTPFTEQELAELRELATTANFATMTPANLRTLTLDLVETAATYLQRAEAYGRIRVSNREAQRAYRRKLQGEAVALGVSVGEVKRRKKGARG